MELRIQLVAVIAAVILLTGVFELVRRRKLQERYALLWLFSSIVILVLACSRSLLTWLSGVIGIYYPPTALFVVAFGFVLVLLLHFCLAVSRLSGQVKMLAQRLALMEEQLHASKAKTISEVKATDDTTQAATTEVQKPTMALE